MNRRMCGYAKRRTRTSILCARSTRHPVRRDEEFLEWLRHVVRLERNLEQVLAIHSRVHHNVHVNGRGLTGLQGRLTDDDFRRSASLQHVGDTRRFEFQRTIANVLDGEHRAHRLIENAIAQVDLFLIHLQAGCA